MFKTVRMTHRTAAARLKALGYQYTARPLYEQVATGLLRIGIVVGLSVLFFPLGLVSSSEHLIGGVPVEVGMALAMIGLGLTMTLAGLMAGRLRRVRWPHDRGTRSARSQPRLRQGSQS
ncbi:hypothetical protein [Pseudoxanthomonas sp. UTMC 1351]|uniref:hypothetical protein n=1 Tax=Pseudoxanthomonas sp. UTMC 1351 TaxID=2695853 RepID=UPI0034CE8981